MTHTKIRKNTAPADAEVSVSWEKRGCADLFYVSGRCVSGFDGQEGMLLLPEQPQIDAYVAIYNACAYWCRPFFGKDPALLPARVQELLIRRGEKYHCYLPVCDSAYKTLICGTEEGMAFRAYSNCSGLTECPRQLAWIEAEGEDPLALLRLCAETAAQALGTGLRMREQRVYPQELEWLGWCSWDAFQTRVNEEGLLQKAAEFREKQVPVGFAIIDDMWANVPALRDIPADADYDSMVAMMHASRLYAFEGDPLRFPNGMQEAVRKLRAAGIPRVGFWFPTTGYWKGFDPEGPSACELREHLTQTAGGRLIVKPDEAHASAYFDRLCGKIADWGGSFVKIDNQGCHGNYKDMTTIGHSARSLHSGIESAVQKHFHGALINCMGMPSECMFSRPDSAVSRCSGDFMPESREWFAKNVLQCAFNGILQGQYYVNDWDMWWTDDTQADRNALCRAISGGPIYISDQPGRTRSEVLKPVCLSDGRLLRPDRSAMPAPDCLTADPTCSGRPFKIFNCVGQTVLLAALNLDAEGKPVQGQLCAAELGVQSERCLIYNFFTGECLAVPAAEKLPLYLADADAYAFFWILPDHGGATVLGRSDLYVGCKAIERDGERYRPAEPGPVAVFSERPLKVLCASGELHTERKGNVYTFFAPGEFTLA